MNVNEQKNDNAAPNPIDNIACASLIWQKLSSDSEMIDYLNNNDIPSQHYIQTLDECARIRMLINNSKSNMFQTNINEDKQKEIQLTLCKIWIDKCTLSHAAKKQLMNLNE